MNDRNMVNPVEVQKYLNIDYPADLNQLVESARSQGAPEEIIATIQRLPDRTYNGPNAVAAELTKLM